MKRKEKKTNGFEPSRSDVGFLLAHITTTYKPAVIRFDVNEKNILVTVALRHFNTVEALKHCYSLALRHFGT